jgi:hypothetical protein
VPLDPRTTKRLIAGAVAGVIALTLWLARIATAPGVEATCTKLLELAALAGERTDESDRAICEERYGHERELRGAIGWAKLSRCVSGARTIPDAGACG